MEKYYPGAYYRSNIYIYIYMVCLRIANHEKDFQLPTYLAIDTILGIARHTYTLQE